MYWHLLEIVCGIAVISQAAKASPLARQLDPISGGDVLRRTEGSDILFPGSDVIKALRLAAHVDSLGQGNLLRSLNTVTHGAVERAINRLSNDEFLNLMDEYRGGEALTVLDRLTGGEITRALENMDGTEVLLALDKEKRKIRDVEQHQTLDPLSGMAFGEMKRMDSLSGASFGLSKRNFDEIDNVGFNGWSKKSYPRRPLALSLAKKGHPGRYGSGLAKRNFDEVDRTGFEGFSKRDVKEHP